MRRVENTAKYSSVLDSNSLASRRETLCTGKNDRYFDFEQPRLSKLPPDVHSRINQHTASHFRVHSRISSSTCFGIFANIEVRAFVK